MSRIGNKPVALPSGVEVIVAENNLVTVKGPKGELSRTFNANMQITVEGNELTVVRPNDNKENKMLHGTTRALLNNMVVGVSEGFTRELEIIGVGYRAQLQGSKLVLAVGKSHPDEVEAPEGITFEVPSATSIVVSGINKEVVGQTAAYIRSLRSPEPYKGKGIRYVGEYVRRKEGKTGK
jgi:large subunit ribosomal protein L6